jgi:hypothetical protein
MYCPKCSEAQVSDDVRFCKRCGLRLQAVQDLIASEEKSRSRADGLLPKQKDISIGAGLMYIGSLVAMFYAGTHVGADGDVLPQVFLILGFTLGFILLLFPTILAGLKKLFSESDNQSISGGEGAQSRKQRDGINLGALLMFLGTIKALVLSTFERNAGKRATLAVAIATGMFLLLLVIRWLAERVYRLFFNFGTDDHVEPERVTGALASKTNQKKPPPALAPGQGEAIPVDVFTSRKSGVSQPASVTERTTGLLDKK